MAALPHLRRLPDRIDRILTLTGRGELRIRTSSTRTVVASSARSSTARCCASSGSRCSSCRRVLLVAADPGPMVADGTGLFEILGYGGLLAGIVLLLRVVAAVARDGTT